MYNSCSDKNIFSAFTVEKICITACKRAEIPCSALQNPLMNKM